MNTLSHGRASFRLCLLATCLVPLTGCQVGRTWFQMDSNAPMPFFGFDLLPRRTVELTPPSTENVAWGTPESSPARIHQVSDRFVGEGRELKLPHISSRSDEEEVSVTGPKPVFSR